MQRPPSIVAYERLYLASLVLSLLSWAVMWPVMAARLAASPALAGATWPLPAIVAASAAISLLLWIFTARRASLVAKWVVVVLAGWSVLRVLLNVPAVLHGALGVAAFALSAATAALGAGAAALLFRADARAWFGEDIHGDVA